MYPSWLSWILFSTAASAFYPFVHHEEQNVDEEHYGLSQETSRTGADGVVTLNLKKFAGVVLMVSIL